MATRYLEHLPANDPLDGYLRFDIAPQLGVHWTPRGFRVFQFVFSRDVYLYEDLEGGFRVVGKFFPPGRLAGELKHFFMRDTGDPWAAEPFIGHFLWEYCGYFPDRQDAFSSITRRIPATISFCSI